MPHRKSSGSRSIQAVPGKSMGNYAMKKAVTKSKPQVVQPVRRVTLAAPNEELEVKMIVCALFPKGPVEKPIALHRRNPSRLACQNCNPCRCSN